MENYIKDYLGQINMDYRRYSSELIECEVCGSKEYEIVREVISISKGNYGRLPVVCCKRCGFLFQNPRLNEKFYEDYYKNNYRNLIFKRNDPTDEFLSNQIFRGKKLFDFVKEHIPKKGKILDVGCSVGGMLIPFIENGWQAFGTDLDSEYVRFGKEKMGLPLEDVKAENMVLEENAYDLIVIIGSLEHIYDPNKTLEICKKAGKNNSVIVLAGRGEPKSHTRDYFNLNHHRYLSKISIELLMIKHGWEPFLTIHEGIYGPKGHSLTSIGKLKKEFEKEDFAQTLEKKYENYSEIIKKFDDHDKNFK